MHPVEGTIMRSILLLTLALLSTGCAAIFGTKQKQFDLQSSPSGAEVYLDGTRLGTTPVKSQLSNQKEHTFVFRKAGYKEVSCTLARGTDGGWVVLDILAGLVPVIIDAATNSWSQTKGSGCLGSLEPLDGAPPAPVVAAQPADGAGTARVGGSAPTPSARPAETADSVVASDEGADRPVAGYDRLPPGTNFIGDIRIKVYYPLGCAAQHAVPADAQVFFQTAGGAETDGFKRSGDC
jgi:hypothetical protein